MRARVNSPRLDIRRAAERFNPLPEIAEQIGEAVRLVRQAIDPRPEWFDYYVAHHAARIALDLEICEQWVNKSHPIAEVGSVPLILTVALKRRGYCVTGFDIDPARFSTAIDALALEVQRCNVEMESIPVPDGKFGSVIFNEIFEHLRINPILTFREIYRILMPGGCLLLSTPNGASYSNLRNLLIFDRALDASVYESFEALESVGHMGHVREYTVTDVADFLASLGFECELVIHRGRYPTNFGQLLARLMPKLRPSFSIIARKPLRVPGRVYSLGES